MANRSAASFTPVLSAVVMTAALLVAVAWRVHLHDLDEQIAQRRFALKRLSVSQGVAPTEDVHAYFKQRDEALLKSYRQWLSRVVIDEPAPATTADLQLFFQERVHEVQRAIERMAAGRNVAVPEMIGLPKELPPTETVPRLLAQLALTQATVGLILEQGPIVVSSVKLEDPEPVNGAESQIAILTRVPLRVRMTSSLPQLMRLLEAVARARPLIDIRALRLTGGSEEGDRIESELVLARYLPAAPLEPMLEMEVADDKAESKSEPAVSKKPRMGEKGASRAETDDGA